jgi:hypothetical protein
MSNTQKTDAYWLRCMLNPASELRRKGLPAGDIISAGYSVPDLKVAGFAPNELRAHFNLIDVAPSFSLGELLMDGIPLSEIAKLGEAAASFPTRNFEHWDLKNQAAQQANHAWFLAQKVHPRSL